MLMKQGLHSFTPIQLASLRLFFAGCVAVTFFIKSFKALSKTDWMYLSISGTIGNFIPAYLFASAGSEMPSSLSGALNATTPFFALLFGVVLFSQLFSLLFCTFNQIIKFSTFSVQVVFASVNPILVV